MPPSSEDRERLPSEAPAPESFAELEPDEFYCDGPYLVFTEAYHRRRGYCCESGCRHCPYGFAGQPPS
jgi:hypothetical protein